MWIVGAVVVNGRILKFCKKILFQVLLCPPQNCVWTGLKLNLGLSGEEMIEVKTYAFRKLSSGTGQTRMAQMGGMHQECSSLKHSTACFSYQKLYILSTLSYLYVMLIRHSICFCKHNLTI